MQTSLLHSRLRAVRFLSLSGPSGGRGLFCFLIGLLLLGSPALVRGQTRYVSTTGTQPVSGATSWAQSTTDLQGAINEMATSFPNSGTVYVASGVYQPGGPANTLATVSFTIASGVTVLGGYEGSGTPGLRTTFPSGTTLSGVLTGGNQSFHVVVMSNVSEQTRLDGFVITGGRATGIGDNSIGGGLFNASSGVGNSSRPMLTNLVIIGNQAVSGGGIYNRAQSIGVASGTLTGVLISQNTATSNGGGIYAEGGTSNLNSLTLTANRASNGGGIFTFSSHTLTATNSLLQSNMATTSGGGIRANGGTSNLTSLTLTANRATLGGGIFTFSSHTLTATNSLLQSNTATSNGGGINADGGTSNLSSLTLTANMAIRGGGIFTTNSHTLTATNSLLQSNTATSNGGGINAEGGTSNLTSLTLTANRAGNGGGVYLTGTNSSTLLNTVIQSNTALTNGGGFYGNTNASGHLINTMLEENTAGTQGGAVFNTGSSLTLTNTTLRNNTAPAATALRNDGTTALLNTIVWGNGTAANAVSGTALVQATYSLFETGTTGFVADPSNIITSTSLFAAPTGPRLSATSEAIDAGLNAAPGLSGVSSDIAGQPRLVNCSVDMGASEDQSATVRPIAIAV